MRILKQILLGLLITLASLSLTVFVVVRYYEDDVVAFAIEKFNEKLATKASVDKVDLSFWKSFPLASLRFNHLYIQETLPGKDTLFYANELFLEFNLFDLFAGKYDIKEIEADQAVANLRVNAKGNDNWHIFKPDSTGAANEFHLSLRSVGISETRVVYEDQKNKFFIDHYSDKALAQGNFSDDQFDLVLESKGLLNGLFSGETEYGSERDLELNTTIDAQTKTGLYTIKSAEVKINDLPFKVSGSASIQEKSNVDFLIEADQLDLQDVLKLLPKDHQDKIKDYNADGIATARVKISGPSSKPEIYLDASIQKGKIENNESGVSLHSIDAKAHYTSTAKMDELKIESFSAGLEEGTIAAQGYLKNVSKEPIADLTIQSDMQLKALRNFLALDTLEVLEGQIKIAAGLSGVLRKKYNSDELDWSAVTTTGTAAFNNGRLKLKNSNRDFTSMSATLLFDKQTASIQHLIGLANGSDFEINGTVTNLLPFLSTTDEILQVDASLNSKLINYSDLVESYESSSTEKYEFTLPTRIRFRLNTTIERFVFGKFEAQNVNGITLMDRNGLRADPISFSTAGGDLLAKLGFSPKEDGSFLVDCSASLSGINIQQIFAEFDNFGQTFITDQNLKGKATSNVVFSSTMSNDMTIVTNSVSSLIDISIDNGELIGLTSLQEIASYIKKNKWVAPFVDEDKFAEKLKVIKFSRLENTIEIKNRTITLPLMNIKSSAMDIMIRGTHTFDNKIDYSLGFNIRDILIKKEKEWQEADDGLGKMLYLFMRGTTERPEFGVDKTMSKDVRQQEMEAEKQNIKALLKQEFGIFKNDSSVGAYKGETTATQSSTQIQWDEFDTVTPEEKPKEKPVKKEEKPPLPDHSKEGKNGKKLPKWLQEKDDEKEN